MRQRWLTPGRRGLTFSQPLRPEGLAPLGFCSGGFTSTSSLRSGQRGSTEVERLSLPRRLITPSERRRVFIRAARESPVGHTPCAGLSASAGASVAATFAACRCPQIVGFPLQPADPHAGHGCRNNRDGSRTIRMRPETVKTFFQKKFRAKFT